MKQSPFEVTWIKLWKYGRFLKVAAHLVDVQISGSFDGSGCQSWVLLNSNWACGHQTLIRKKQSNCASQSDIIPGSTCNIFNHYTTDMHAVFRISACQLWFATRSEFPKQTWTDSDGPVSNEPSHIDILQQIWCADSGPTWTVPRNVSVSKQIRTPL